jgi:hypothetical protein
MSDRRSRRSNVLRCDVCSPSSVFRYQFTLKLDMIPPTDGSDVKYLLFIVNRPDMVGVCCVRSYPATPYKEVRVADHAELGVATENLELAL